MDEMLISTLECTFGFTTFKSSNQRDGINAVLKGDRDVFINLPPNSGKSLCYQLPAIICQEKSAIVFVRNNNTAQDHVNYFIGKNTNVCHIDSLLQPKKKQERVEQLKCGKLAASLIYIPVSLCNKSWIKDLITTLGSRNSISIFVIDEALYLSPNSTSFHKQALDIVPLRNMFPNVPLIALSASGSHQIKCDIFNALSLKNPHEIIHDNWTLPNIYVRVKFKDIIANPYQDVVELINNFKETIKGKFGGIIFCRSKEETIIVAQELSRLNVTTVPYNTSMKILDRKKNKSMWKVGKAIMISTTHNSAIGLDKPNVSCIIHWSVPPSILEYYQEISKAGRSGNKALCCLYFNLNDWMYIRGLTMRMSQYAYDNSEKMIQFCLAEECRHAMYSRYFESIAVNCEDCCDWCFEKDNVEKSLEAFNDFQSQHRLLSLNPQTNNADYLNVGVYDVQNTKKIIKNLRINARFYWYEKLSNSLIKNYKMANCPNKKEMTIKNLCRLARNLEYCQLLASYGRANYIIGVSAVVDAINKQTIQKNLSNCILNYDCVAGEMTKRHIDEDISDLLSIAVKSLKTQA